MQNILELKNIGYSYHSLHGETRALKNISFGVREGEFVKAGQQIGVIRDYWGNELSCYHAPYDGVVLYLTHTLWVDGKVEIYTVARKPD